MGGNSFTGPAGQTTGATGATGPLSQNVMGAYNQALGGARDAIGQGNNLMGRGLGTLGQATGIMGNMAGMNPGNVKAGQLAGTNLNPYMNPYQRNVINTTMGEMNRQETMQDNNIQDAAQRAGAFGGDRMAIQQAENNRNYDAQRAQTLAGLNSSNFANAQQMATGDINRTMQANLANQGVRAGQQQFGAQGLAGVGQGLMGMGQNQNQFGQNQLGNLANMGFGWGQNLEQRQMQMGGMQQQQQQQLLDLIKGQTQGWTGYGDTGLARYFGSISSPNGYGTQNSNSTTSSNPGIMGILGGIGSMIAPFMSDIRLKKNVKPSGFIKVKGDNGTSHDLGVYEYNYMWDNKTRYRGVMAQEVLQVKPSAVIQVGDFLAVNYAAL
jgi:hypothetical protein